MQITVESLTQDRVFCSARANLCLIRIGQLNRGLAAAESRNNNGLTWWFAMRRDRYADEVCCLVREMDAIDYLVAVI